MFKFTIRELLLLTVVVALAVGWTISARQNQRMRMEHQRVQKANERIWSEYIELREFNNPLDDDDFSPPYGGIKSIHILRENPGQPPSERKGIQK